MGALPNLVTKPIDQIFKDQENPDFCASGTCGRFPYNPVVGSGTYGNGPVGTEILTFNITLYIRPGLIPSNFSTTHFPILFGSLINIPEGFCSEVTI